MCVAISFHAPHAYYCYNFGFKAEEAPSALLLVQAALLSTKKQARRRAALWYVSAAGRLEKCGIVSSFLCRTRRTLMVISLKIYFLRKARELCSVPLPKELSPSFCDSEGKSSMVAEGL